jgi:hypothetical protein
MYYTLKPISINEENNDNIMFGPEPKSMGLNSVKEVDLFQFLYNWEYIILLVSLVSIGFIIRSYIVSKWSTQKSKQFYNVITSLWFTKINYVFLNLIMFLFIFYLNNSMILCSKQWGNDEFYHSCEPTPTPPTPTPPNRGDLVVNLLFVIGILAQLIYYYLNPIPVPTDNKDKDKVSVDEDNNSNLMSNSEIKSIKLNSINEMDLFQFLYNWKFIIVGVFLLMLLVALVIMFIIRNSTTGNIILQGKNQLYNFIVNDVWFTKVKFVIMSFLNMFSSFFYFIFFLNSPIVLCLGNDELSLPNGNGDKSIVLTCILISLLVAACLLQNKSTTNSNSSIDLSEIGKKQNLPKLTLDLKNEMLVYKDPIDGVNGVNGLPNPILVTLGVSMAIGLCVYYLHDRLKNEEMFNNSKKKSK